MLKYQKGTFVVVPNINRFVVLPAMAQALFLWLCKYADENGICFPSRKKLASNLKCDMRTVDRHIALLEQEGFVTKTKRRKIGDKTNKSNLYQILIAPEQGDSIAEQGDFNATCQVDTDVPVTISSINYTHLTQLSEPPASDDKPFLFIEELNRLKESKRKIDKIVHLYLTRKNRTFENKDQYITEYRRDLKAAKSLMGYNSEQIWQTFDYCDKNHNEYGWSLETVVKVISKVINQR